MSERDEVQRYVAAFPVTFEGLPPEHRRLYRDVVHQGLQVMQYPDSVAMPCRACGVAVAVGPRGQVAVADGAWVMCMVDAAYEAAKVGDTGLVSLDNPYATPRPIQP